MKTLLTLTILFLSELTFSQIVIKGRVLDYYDKAPLSNVEIISNVGILSDIDGQFELNVDNKENVSFYFPGYYDLIFLYPDDIDTLVCDLYMISIEPYKLCLADGFIKHIYGKEPICSNYSRKMDKIWIKKRLVDKNTPLNWRLDCLENYGFVEKQNGLRMQYQIVFNEDFFDYRKYREKKEKDYVYCEIKY